jgi:DNA-binding response OmpR family regulator/nitrogen-specific signal transduction histidine kinase
LRHDLEIKELEKSKIEELNQLELRFFTNISHEFKTPLTLIQGPLEQIISEKKYDEKTGKKLSIMQANTRRLLRLISQLLEFRKVKQSTLDLHVKHLDIIAFLDEIKAAFDELAEIKKIDFSFKHEIKEPSAWFDPDKIEKIIYNLLSNAFKHTPESGYIILRASAENDGTLSRFSEKSQSMKKPSILISVTNSGRGIPKEKIEKLFERFYMLDDHQLYSSSMDSGSGIGLSLSKSLIERHNGFIAAESTLNEETTFTIVFPSSAESYSDEERVTSDHEYNLVFTQRGRDELMLTADPGDHIPSNGSPDDLSFKKSATILLAEDNREMRNYIEQMLEDDFKIETADNGKEAYEITRQINPDIILTDIMMPEMDGMELCERIKREQETCHIPIIMLTAKGEDNDKISGLRTGADDYITKPFHPDELLQKLKNIVTTRKRAWEKFQKGSILEPTDIAVTSFDEKFLKNAVVAVEEHIDDPDFDVSGLVSHTGMSRSVMYRKLKALTGQSANEFINTIRLKRAAQLLKKQKLSVSEITYMVGYNDPQYFSKCFKKQFGQTPSQFAAEAKQES